MMKKPPPVPPDETPRDVYAWAAYGLRVKFHELIAAIERTAPDELPALAAELIRHPRVWQDIEATEQERIKGLQAAPRMTEDDVRDEPADRGWPNTIGPIVEAMESAGPLRLTLADEPRKGKRPPKSAATLSKMAANMRKRWKWIRKNGGHTLQDYSKMRAAIRAGKIITKG
ncbi:MAG: hypothetical protein ABWY78_06430 [Microvirga sp.]